MKKIIGKIKIQTNFGAGGDPCNSFAIYADDTTLYS